MNQVVSKTIALFVAAAMTLWPVAPALADHDDFPTRTPIKHVVVIFQENVSFDHYFGTYPHAKPNLDSTQYFAGAADDTPRVNNLESSGLLTNNPNLDNPSRLDRSMANTCDQDHAYGPEQAAFDGGLMDKFVQETAGAACVDKTIVMDYYDGNTVTGIWNYAQHFAMSDNFFGSTFGPSTPGAVSVISGTTFEGSVTNGGPPLGILANNTSPASVIGDADPGGDMCSSSKTQITMSGKNVGDLLNTAGITWGSFMGGFGNCAHVSTGITGLSTADYIPHHAWFQYWASTLNANHLPPTSDAMIGKSDQAKHEYDISAFWTAVKDHNMPAVSYIKAPAIEDGHAGYSDPLDEQNFIVNFINALEKTDEWNETAVFITYDDSDGWYDHQMGPIIRQSDVSDDELLGPGNCGKPTPIDLDNDGDPAIENGRCGFGPRIPLLVISAYSRRNYVDHRVLDFSSIVRFIEDNWNLGRIGGNSGDTIAGKLDGLFDFDDGPQAPKIFLDPLTGQILHIDHDGDDH